MRCPGCQHENPAGGKFCNACGSRLPAPCPACGHDSPAGSRFCSECGQRLGDESPAPAERFRNPEAYTPHHLAEKILTSRAALEGERKQVTVLFADVRGSLELLADRDPEEARALLDPVLDRMMEAAHRYDGTVNQVMGDGVMALFGAPVAREDHAVRACYAALRMQETVSRYGDEVQRTHGVPLQIRIGLNSGEVVVRSIGSDLRMDYTAVGQTTHLAARMEQMAKPGSVLVTAETMKLAEGHVEARRLGPTTVKGLPAPVEVFELIGARMAPSRLHTPGRGTLSPFVGREAEMAQLRRAGEEAGGGRGRVVAVVGEPGVGKTRLLLEFTQGPRNQGWLVLETGAVSHGAAVPYLPIVGLLKAYFELEEGATPERTRERVAARLMDLGGRLQDTITPVLFLLDALPAEHPFRSVEASLQRAHVRDGAKRLLLREGQRQPVLLVVENLQWADPESRALLEALVESVPTSPILLLLSYRPEFQHGWGNRSGYAQLRLDPLAPASAEALLGELLGNDPGLEPLKQLLVKRTEGNPFFLEESIRSLVEMQVLAGDRGGYRLAKAPQAIQIPVSVQAVLADRIDRLTPEDKRLLQAAAVIGTDVPFPVLGAIAEASDAALREALSRLQAAEFLYERALFPELRYTFRHALTQEVAYATLLADQRRALHARVIRAIETLYPDRIVEYRDQLAHHVARGEVWSKAAAYFRPTVDEAHPFMEASFWWTGAYDRALEVARENLAMALEYRNFGLNIVANLRLGQVYHSLGRYGPAVEALRGPLEALEGNLRFERFGLPALASVLVRTWLAWSLAHRGEFGEAAALGAEALEIAEHAGDRYGWTLASVGLGLVHLAAGEPEAAAAVLEPALAEARGPALASLAPLAAAPLGGAYALAGRAAEGLRLVEEALQEAEQLDLRADHAMRLVWLGEAQGAAGRPEAAAESARQAEEAARQRGERGHEAYALRLLGEVALHGSPPDLAAAEVAYRGAAALARELGMRPLLARSRLGLGRTWRLGGQPEPARAELEAAAALARALGARRWLAEAEALLDARR